MSNPKVNQTIGDGGLGAVDISTGDVPVVMGCCSAGTVNVPLKFGGGSVTALVAACGYGPGTQEAALALAAGRDVVFIKLPSSTSGTNSAVTTTGGGTSVITLTPAGGALDSAELVLEALVGGTIGVAGIVFRLSKDNGRTWSPNIALGTATSYVIPNLGISFAFAAGTILVGQKSTAQITEPKWVAGDLPAAYTALRSSALTWDFIAIAGKMTAAEAGSNQTELDLLANTYAISTGAMIETRGQTAAESDATWKGSIQTDYAAFTTKRQLIGAGKSVVKSPIDGSSYMRPATWLALQRYCGVDVAVDLAQVDLGPLPTTLTDSNGNPITAADGTQIAHNEFLSPGLDDSRFMTLTTIPNFKGVFITNPRIMSPQGSDFEFWQHRRVMDKAYKAAYIALALQLSKGFRVYKSGDRKGFIIEKDAKRIENKVNEALRTEILDKGRASSADFILSRTDNVLSTKTINGTTRIAPLAYPKVINNDIAYFNPALEPIAA